MEKQEVVFNTSEPKKHSVRFKTKDPEAAISDVYIRRSAFGSGDIPKVIKITIEEV